MGKVNEGIINVAAITLKDIEIANPRSNTDKIIKHIKDIIDNNVKGIKNTKVVVFPELAITGYTCGDLFNSSLLIDESLECLKDICKNTKNEFAPIVFVGIPIRKDNQLFNCCAIIQNGELLGLVPKTYLPNYSVFYEMRNFKSSKDRLNDEYDFFGEIVPFTTNLLIKDINSDLIIGTEICEDLWVPIAPSRYHCLNGANLIVNLSASNEIIGKSKYREDLIRLHSATCMCGYVYVSSGISESTTDNVFSGHTLIAENGSIITQNKFLSNQEVVYGDIDIEKCINERTTNISYMELPLEQLNKNYIIKKVSLFKEIEFKCERNINLYPFVPKNINERADEIINIQAAGLAQRLKKINCNKVVLGISGGLDSTLALLVSIEAFELNNYDLKGIIGITMPCFGTSNRTLSNSEKLMESLNITQFKIDIKAACEQHLRDINHDANLLDITYENSQARERTQILMDMANKHNAIVVGTGDLSELALGWCTYNGDQMSMYGVNSSIPKTLVRSLVKSYAMCKTNEITKNILLDICDTPVSPELLPPNENGTISQLTENSIGSYVTHDFIIYNMLRFNFSPSKIYKMYLIALEQYNIENNIEENIDKEKIYKDFNIFYNRFFTQQFKRSCMPDGIKVGSISLSPRGDLRMPSDACKTLWLKDLEKIK